MALIEERVNDNTSLEKNHVSCVRKEKMYIRFDTSSIQNEKYKM